ncbi:hypothetical protein Lepto7376_1330 [[Leptolyngbya] sp. PCC 7376]|nr:hypothetical protein Lepto7376_1330 [[Leptolyngbya] sp. PCC 7376]
MKRDEINGKYIWHIGATKFHDFTMPLSVVSEKNQPS